MPTDMPLIGLISAVPAAIPPAVAAFADVFPEARPWNILDDRLLQDADEAGGVTAVLASRMDRLIDHAAHGGADAILLTCSMYSMVARNMQRRSHLPVLGPDDALFAAASSGNYRTILLISSAAAPLADSVQRLSETAAGSIAIHGSVARGAAEAARAGDSDVLADRIIAAVSDADSVPDAVVLGQYSLAPAAAAVEASTRIPVLAGPLSAARALRDQLSGGAV